MNREAHISEAESLLSAMWDEYRDDASRQCYATAALAHATLAGVVGEGGEASDD